MAQRKSIFQSVSESTFGTTSTDKPLVDPENPPLTTPATNYATSATTKKNNNSFKSRHATTRHNPYPREKSGQTSLSHLQIG